MTEQPPPVLGPIQRAGATVELRLRISAALRVLPYSLTVALGVGGVALAIRKLLPGLLSNNRAWHVILAAAFCGLAIPLLAAARRLAPNAGTITLDRHHGLKGQLTNAVSFGSSKHRTALMEAAIIDACALANNLKPSKAAPLHLPKDLVAPLGLAVALAIMAALKVPTAKVEVPPKAAEIDAVQMTPDDVELFRDAAKRFEHAEQSPELQAAIAKFNQLVEDISNKRLDRAEAFRRMEEIERELFARTEADSKDLHDALKQTADELAKAELAKPVADALKKQELGKAQKELRDLAASLKGNKKPSKSQIQKLQGAMQRAAARRKEALAAINDKRNELRDQLLAKKSRKNDSDAGAPPEDDRLLKKKERELERLDREAEREERAGRQLDRLDRDLARAAEDLAKELGLSGEDLERAAEDINRMEQEEMSEKEKEELRQRLEELRELLRQQGKGAKERLSRMLKFGKRARGSSGKGQKGDRGQQGNGQEGEDSEAGEGQDGKDGKMAGSSGQTILQLTRGGAGQSPAPGAGAPGGSGQGPDSPGGSPGKGIGTSHDGNLKGERTDLKGSTTDVEEQGLDTKQGPSNSQVIQAAAERGFRGKGYKKVFTDYHRVAETDINKDRVPDGYRFYVHRYFQLIRPRD